MSNGTFSQVNSVIVLNKQYIFGFQNKLKAVLFAQIFKE